MARAKPTSGDLPRRKRQPHPAVKAAADRAEALAKGKPVKKEASQSALRPPEVKPKIGRPTKYRAELCQTVIDLGNAGKSKVQIARTLGISRDTLNQWSKKYLEFSDSLKKARDLELAWWEDAGQAGMYLGQKGFNATTYIFIMKNRFREDYNDKVDVGLSADSALVKLWEAIGSRKVSGQSLEGERA